MSRDRDEQQNTRGGDFSLEEILAEYGDGGKVVPFPHAHGTAVLPEEPEESPGGEDTQETGESALPPPPQAKTGGSAERVVDFPAEHPEEEPPAPSPLKKGIDKLLKKADAYAEHMFEEEGVENDADVRTAEKYLPGVDAEEDAVPLRQRRPRRVPAPAPDLPPQELYRRYNRGLSFLRLRAILVLVLALPLLYLTLAPFFHWPLPGMLGSSYSLRVYTLAGMLGAAMLLGADVFLAGFFKVIYSGFGMDTLVSLSCVATLADALTLEIMGGRDGQLPYCAISAFALAMAMWGRYLQRRGQRSACRTAASASEPYLVTLDEEKWNGRPAYAKWSGESVGFGSQIQGSDGAQRIFRVTVPLLFVACILLSLISSLGQERPELILWCLSSTLTAAASFSSLLCFGLPWSRLSLRLAKSGAALAGWDAVAEAGGESGILLTDTDLFPPGAVALNGIKVFGDFPVEKVVACAATLIRDSGSGLDRIFHDLLRAQGAIYRRCEQFAPYEGGLTALVRGDQVLVGSAAFMHLMEIPLPQGLSVKNAVFCAINGELAGVFALNYSLHSAIAPSITALIHNKIGPVLATRDFNLIPAMLRQRFKLPVEKMEFPPVERRSALSAPGQEHNSILTAVLCREGLGPFSEAVVGARRLRVAVGLNATLACLGSAVGVLMAFYLNFVGSFASLSPANLLLFLLAWLVPVLLISGWVERY